MSTSSNMEIIIVVVVVVAAGKWRAICVGVFVF